MESKRAAIDRTAFLVARHIRDEGLFAHKHASIALQVTQAQFEADIERATQEFRNMVERNA